MTLYVKSKYGKADVKQAYEEARYSEKKQIKESDAQLRKLEQYHKHSVSSQDRGAIEQAMMNAEAKRRSTEKMLNRSQTERLAHRAEIMNRKEKFPQ